MYGRQKMVLPRKTKSYAAYSDPEPPFGPPDPRNLYRLLHPNPRPDGTGEKIKNYCLSKPTKSCLAKEKASAIMKLKFVLDIDVFFKVDIML